MDNKDRRIIKDNLNYLKNKTDYDILIRECHRREMITKKMVDLNMAIDPQSRHAALLEKITHRGPKAFNILLDICHAYFPDAYKVLKPDSNCRLFKSLHHKSGGEPAEEIEEEEREQDQLDHKMRELNIQNNNENVARNIPNYDYDNNGGILLKQYTKHIEKLHTVIQAKKLIKDHFNPAVSVYPMLKKDRGVLLLINMIRFKTSKPRKGANADKNNMLSVFSQLNFKIFYYEDINRSELFDLIRDLKSSNDLKQAECFIFGMMTHGDHKDGKTFIEFPDGSMENVENIFIEFNNEKCRALLHKPKVFLFPFCRGDTTDFGISNQRSSLKTEKDGQANASSSNFPTNTGTFTDMLIIYATVPGFQTHRDIENGSWFIEDFCSTLAKHAHDTNLDDMVKIANQCTKKIRTDKNSLQTNSSEQRGFDRHLYFNPGLWDSE